LAYESQEITTANAAYLPEYFCKALHVALTKGGPSSTIQIGIEVVAEPTGLDPATNLPKGIPFSYGIRNLIARRADDPLNEVKRAMGNKLRLPPPPSDTRVNAPVALPSSEGQAPVTVPAVFREEVTEVSSPVAKGKKQG
jgi:hypothetical protein